MAELRIERGERAQWPWIVALLVLLLMAWFFFGRRPTDPAVRDPGAPPALDTGVAPGGAPDAGRASPNGHRLP